jgi:hypothetical protein
MRGVWNAGAHFALGLIAFRLDTRPDFVELMVLVFSYSKISAIGWTETDLT